MMNNFTPRANRFWHSHARRQTASITTTSARSILLGLIKLGQGVAVNVLTKLGLDLETVRLQVEQQVGSGPETKMVGNIPYTPCEKGARSRLQGGQGAQSQLRRHGAHPARPAA
jgi:ATP-dependent Clp protease ATP-binding subunit ClpC